VLTTAFLPVINPALNQTDKIFFDRDFNGIRITADEKSFKTFFKSSELQSKLPKPDKAGKGRIGHMIWTREPFKALNTNL